MAKSLNSGTSNSEDQKSYEYYETLDTCSRLLNVMIAKYGRANDSEAKKYISDSIIKLTLKTLTEPQIKMMTNKFSDIHKSNLKNLDNDQPLKRIF